MEENKPKILKYLNVNSSSASYVLQDSRINNLDTNELTNNDFNIPSSSYLYNNGKIKIAGIEITTVGADGEGIISSKALRENLGLSNVLHFRGIATVEISDGSNIDPEIEGYNTRANGDIIIDKNNACEYIWYEDHWECLGPEGLYVTKDELNNLVIPWEKITNVPEASTSTAGIVKLNSAINSTATNLAATPSAVKTAYDLASSALATAEANVYTLPEATTSVLGGVTVGDNITVNNGKISITSANVIAALGYSPSSSGAGPVYTIATTTSDGLMSSAMVSQLSNAVTSTASTGVGNVITDISLSNGTLTVTKDNISITDTKNTVGATTTASNLYFIGVNDITSTASRQSYITGSTAAYVTSNGELYGYRVFNAVFNDYAEYREVEDDIEAGRVVRELGDGKMVMTEQRLEPACAIITDTFGNAMGKTEKCKTPIGIAGRVLAYPYENIEEFKNNIGKPVCSGPNGTVSIMTDEEYRNYGYKIIGIISEIPNYETWGSNKIQVNGRVWINIK